MLHSTEQDAISKAWVKFQATVPNPTKGHKADTGKFSYKYASLDDILAEMRPLLAKCDLAISQDSRPQLGSGGCPSPHGVGSTSADGCMGQIHDSPDRRRPGRTHRYVPLQRV